MAERDVLQERFDGLVADFEGGPLRAPGVADVYARAHRRKVTQVGVAAAVLALLLGVGAALLPLAGTDRSNTPISPPPVPPGAFLTTTDAASIAGSWTQEPHWAAVTTVPAKLRWPSACTPMVPGGQTVDLVAAPSSTGDLVESTLVDARTAAAASELRDRLAADVRACMAAAAHVSHPPVGEVVPGAAVDGATVYRQTVPDEAVRFAVASQYVVVAESGSRVAVVTWRFWAQDVASDSVLRSLARRIVERLASS